MSSEAVSILGHALLGLLAGRPMSGYDLTRTFDGTLHFVWSAKHAQIYPELSRLARDGYLIQGATGARGRKVYAITPSGSEELRRWLVETSPDRSPRNEVLLRAFFMWSVPAQDARAYFEERERVARDALAQFESIAATFEPKTPEELAFRIALESGLRLTRAAAEWAQWAAEQYRA
jgi:PadR family transcriptional regulator, regulatory protein AphA